MPLHSPPRRSCLVLAFGQVNVTDIVEPGTCLLSYDRTAARAATLTLAGPTVEWSSGFYPKGESEWWGRGRE